MATTSLPNSTFVSKAPARLCLFGEHQDYLGLPVIACAVPLHCRIEVTIHPSSISNDDDHDNPESARLLTLRVPQLDQVKTYNLDELPPRQSSDSDEPLDFALAALHEVVDAGWRFPSTLSADCVSTTEFPMQAGISSSSAFCVAWCHVLARLAGKTPISPLELAQWAHRAEVTHFGGPGGTMDHVTSALGGMLRIGPGKWDVTQLPTFTAAANDTNKINDRGVWVLAYSGEPKDTLKHLHRCKNARLDLLQNKLAGNWDATPHDDNVNSLTKDEQALLQATIINRDMEQQAFDSWKTERGSTIAEWMQQHHEALRDGLHLSTPRLEAMNVAAHGAGAWGFKVVGSGGGGCAVAWTPTNMAETVAEAMKAAGATDTWIVAEPAKGATLK